MKIKLIKVLVIQASHLPKIILRTILFLVCTTIFSFSPNPLISQNPKITIDKDKAVTIYEVLEIIGNQTECTFIYQSDIFKELPKIDLKKGIIKVNELLKQCLPPSDFSIITTKNNYITITRRSGKVSQQNNIKGVVTDSLGIGMAGVNIFIKNTAKGTQSNLDGQYTVIAHPSDTLVFTYLGFKPQEIMVGNRSILNVVMVLDATALDQVVINAGYYKVSDREKTGSIVRVTAAEIEKQPVSNPLATLQGRLTGVEVIQNSGVPGGGFDIRIRGRNSIRVDGNDPLYIVDGVPYPSASLGVNTISAVLGGTQSALNGISPTDIESIEILKDADATAIYGSRGANGVVLITTKKGKAGKTQFSVSQESGVGTITRTQKLLNTEQYLQLRKEAFANDGITTYPFYEYDINGTWDQNRYTDWQKVLLGGTAYFTRTQASVSGGNEETRFLLRGSHQKETTVFPGDFDYKKNAVLGSLNHQTKDKKFRVHFSGNYVSDRNNLPATSFIFLSRSLAPNAPALYDDNGELNWEDGTFRNPLAQLNAAYLSKTDNLIGSGFIEYQPFKNLWLKTNLGYNSINLEESRTSPNTLFDPAFGLDSSNSSITVNNARRTSWIVEPQLEYELKFDKAKIEVLIGSSFQSENSRRTIRFAEGFTTNALINDPSAAASISIKSFTDDEYRYNAIFGRVNLNWAKKYILNLTGRRDGSSRFGPGKQFANFGAVGAAWLFGEEPLIEEAIPFLSFGKFHGSYGTSGNDQIGNYKYLNTYVGSGISYEGIPGLEPSQLYNPIFGWETNRKLEFGVEIGILKDRVLLASTYYRNRSSNQLVGIPLPGTTGFTSVNSNLDATVQNSGLEMELNTVNLNSKNLKWTTGINLSIPRNKLISFPGLEESTYANDLVIGEPLDIEILYNYLGVDPTTGLYTFQDYDGDGTITSPNDLKKAVYRGVNYYGGLVNTLTYKNISLDFLLQFVKQTGWTYETSNSMPGTGSNQPIDILNHWQNPGDNSNNQLLSAGYLDAPYIAFDKYQHSSGVIGDASYMRLKNASLSYRVPKNNLGIDCRIYIQGQNLFTVTNYKGADPESRNTSQLPPLKMWSLGTEIKF
ncbi:TonB-linked outer membrane protein, SusC/RagA family [Aequorivita sublithincola DSM 14238]|uniref:TonB-linked outer membrane protein, SusC/RagA family n=1 Tax=Aequorivita sublithincola (strain DSM 14238 / LMG 21431 / ACAM 643 / 9-3) TaxID=746697 RepID=I3YZV6_AEQSU|nr:SusC/RagA family TonB-linked outer membrane protein [Aequorivita sublithincola]AFL82524.1 TonB-linked outer membrane protein, SusC/RagA family [Aequorivita sublithincola DSM 14238]